MKSLSQSSARDFVVNAGRIVLNEDLDSAMAIIDNTVRSQLGEYRYNTTKGVDYFDNVFGPNPNYQLFESQVRAEVLGLDFVNSIDSFSYDVSSNVLSYDMQVSTIYGTGTVTNG